MSDLKLESGVKLSLLTTFKVGGEAEYLLHAQNVEQLAAAVLWAKENKLAITIIGGGSNILASDDGVSGLVVVMDSKGVSVETSSEEVFVTVAAGEVMDDFIAYTVKQGWWGLENLSAIPGKVGAAPVQNVGAYGVEAGDLISSVQVFNIKTGTVEMLSASECCFGYRDSIFKTAEGKKYIVTAVTFKLSLFPKPKLSYRDLLERFSTECNDQGAVREAIIDIRSQKFPDWRVVGTAGSFFKNPVVSLAHYESLLKKYPELPGYIDASKQVKIPLGYVLDKVCGLKGFSKDAVGLYEKQALVVVNNGGATAKEIKNFAKMIAKKVKEKINVDVEWEVTKI